MHAKQITFQKDFSKFQSLKVGVVSDTHSYIDTAIHEQVSDCDVILHAGDIGCADVINQLKDISKHVISVRGNNDVPEKWPSEDHVELEDIHEIAEINLPGGSIVLLHGDKYNPVSTRHAEMRQHYPQAKAIIYGHSHKLVCDQSQLPWVLNPGASGKARTKGGASCLIIEISQQKWKISTFRKTV